MNDNAAEYSRSSFKPFITLVVALALMLAACSAESIGGVGVDEDWRPPTDAASTQEWKDTVAALLVTNGQLDELFDVIAPLPVSLPALESDVAVTSWSVAAQIDDGPESKAEDETRRTNWNSQFDPPRAPEASATLAVESADSYSELEAVFQGWFDERLAEGWGAYFESTTESTETFRIFSIVRGASYDELTSPNNPRHSEEKLTIRIQEHETHRTISVVMRDQVRVSDRFGEWVAAAASSLPSSAEDTPPAVNIVADLSRRSVRVSASDSFLPADVDELRKLVSETDLDVSYAGADELAVTFEGNEGESLIVSLPGPEGQTSVTYEFGL